MKFCVLSGYYYERIVVAIVMLLVLSVFLGTIEVKVLERGVVLQSIYIGTEI